jgi:hypothetical protein
MPEHRSADESLIVERDRWFSSSFSECRPKRYGPISTIALLLEVDIRAAFCAGAWLSVIVLAAAAIEAQFRQVYREDYDSKLIDLCGSSGDLHWLRELRNEILHASKPGTKSSLWKHSANDLRACHAALEPEARRAVSIMFRNLYAAKLA